VIPYIFLAHINSAAQVNQSEDTVEFQALMHNAENIDRCLEMARTRCLRVWQLLSRERVRRYRQEWRSGRGQEDEVALVYSLVAIGSRYVGECDPTPAQANTLFSNAQRLLLNATDFDISSARLIAIYITVCFHTLKIGLTA
jgi:hypothetical protein